MGSATAQRPVLVVLLGTSPQRKAPVNAQAGLAGMANFLDQTCNLTGFNLTKSLRLNVLGSNIQGFQGGRPTRRKHVVVQVLACPLYSVIVQTIASADHLRRKSRRTGLSNLHD